MTGTTVRVMLPASLGAWDSASKDIFFRFNLSKVTANKLFSVFLWVLVPLALPADSKST